MRSWQDQVQRTGSVQFSLSLLSECQAFGRWQLSKERSRSSTLGRTVNTSSSWSSFACREVIKAVINCTHFQQLHDFYEHFCQFSRCHHCSIMHSDRLSHITDKVDKSSIQVLYHNLVLLSLKLKLKKNCHQTKPLIHFNLKKGEKPKCWINFQGPN